MPSGDPATGEVLARIAEGMIGDVDKAVAAALRALERPFGSGCPGGRQRRISTDFVWV